MSQTWQRRVTGNEVANIEAGVTSLAALVPCDGTAECNGRCTEGLQQQHSTPLLLPAKESDETTMRASNGPGALEPRVDLRDGFVVTL